MSNEELGVQLEVIAQHSEGYFGDPSGYEELLYSTKTANSFLLIGKGGYASKYSATVIRELTRKQAQDYLARLKGEEKALKIIPNLQKAAAKSTTKPAAKSTTKPVAKSAAKTTSKKAASASKKAITKKPTAKKTEVKK